MTAHVLVFGVLYRQAERRLSRAGNLFVTATNADYEAARGAFSQRSAPSVALPLGAVRLGMRRDGRGGYVAETATTLDPALSAAQLGLEGSA